MSTTVGFIIIENEDGLGVVEVQPNEAAEDAAVRNNGVVVDPGPYPTYDAAYEAMETIPATEEEDELPS